MSVTHTFVSAKPPVADPTQIGSAEWNAAHTVSIDDADVAAAAAIAESKLALNYATHPAVTLGTANGLVLVGQQLSLGFASGTSAGALSGGDWQLFFNKQSALGYTPEDVANKDIDTTLAANSDIKYPSQKAIKAYVDSGLATGTHAPVTLGTPNGLSLSGQQLSLSLASGTTTGALSGADWQIFFGKQNALTLPLSPANGGTGVNNGAFALTVPATGTAALLATANVFTVNQMVDGTADAIQMRVQGHSTQTANIQTWEISTGAVMGYVDGAATQGSLIWNKGTDVSNTFIGYSAGNATLAATGIANTAIGWSAGRALSSAGVGQGSANLLFGSSAGILITIGSGNVAVGGNSLTKLTTQSYCTAIGSQALKNATGQGNIGISFDSGASVSSGQNNIAIGVQALAGGTVTGHRNIVLGFNAGYYLTGSGSDQLLIDTQTRANAAQEVQQAIIYGSMASGGYLAHNIGTTTTNAVKEVLRLQAFVDTASTGAANGFGPALNLYGETATDLTYQQMAQVAASWIDATNATRKAKLSLSAYDTAARLGIEVEASGAAAKLGFFGHATALQPAAYTASNVSADRSYDANSTSIDELADVLGTLIADLQSVGLIG